MRYEHPNPALQTAISRANDLRAERNRSGILPQHEAAELAQLERELSAPMPRRAGPDSASPFLERDVVTFEPRARSRGAAFSGYRSGRTGDERAYRFGQWALCRLTMDMPNRYQFPTAVEFTRENWGLSTEGGPDFGSVLVPNEFGQDLIDLRESYGVVRKIFKMRRMTSDTRTDPRRAGGLTAYAVGEGAAGTESTKEWNQVRLTAKKWMCLTRYTNEISADAVIDLGNDLADEMAYAFADKEDECGINGDGTSTYHRITGVRAALGAAAGSPTTTSAGGIIVGAGNAYSELTLANFHSVASILPRYADNARTVWLCSKQFYHVTMERLMMAQGGSTARELRDGLGTPVFMGYPVVLSSSMPTTEANSQVCCLLGDFTLGASFGDRQRDEIAFSEGASVNSQSLWERDEIGVRGTTRFDINVHDVGNTTTAGPIVGLQTLNS